jgi:aminoglycoside phosphotransferase (APT) family kinase protein
LWRLPRRTAADVLLRIFPAGSPSAHAEREAAAQRLAIAHGVGAPAVLRCAVIAGCPVLAMEWVDAPTVSTMLLGGSDPQHVGRQCGRQLAMLHEITDAAVVDSPTILERNWIDWAGARADRLRAPIRSTADLADRRLLHLDFHPDNLLLDGDDVVVLDWANTRIGPRSADLARSASILQLIEHHPDLGDLGRSVIAGYRSGFSVGYQEVTGLDPDTATPRAVQAWAAAVALQDLVGADWVPDAVLDQFERCYRDGLG